MKLSQLLNRKWNYSALAFAFPFFGMLVIMVIGQYSPFGQYSMLYSDMYHQYFPFFKEFRRALLSGESLLYNWSVGLGMDYLGLIAYYLSSPLNLLSVLVPEKWILGYFSLLVPIKLGLASLFFSIFLKKIFQKDDISLALFGSFYGLCAWALGYQWNVMWLDTFALLPLVVLGMVSLLKERKFILYTFTLFLSVFSNYYIGLFTCIFIFLLFVCYEICRWEGFRKFFADLIWIAVFSVLAIGMTAILELPAFVSLQQTQSSVNKFPEGFQLNIADEKNWKGLLKAMVQVAGNANGGIEPTFKEGLPNLYCGVLTTILAILYLFNSKVRLRDKICAAFLLLFFNISFIIRQLDYIWHGFHFTNMIPYRFSFLYSFVMLYMAYAAWTNRKTFRLWQIILASVISIALLFCYEDLADIVYWAYNAVFLLLYISTLFFQTVFKPAPADADSELRHQFRKERIVRKRICSNILLGVMSIEIILNFVNFGVSFPGTNTTNYPKGKNDTLQVLEYMNSVEKGTPFFRTETAHTQTLNDGALNGYYGVSTFTSSANVNVTKFMRALGYGAKDTYNRYCFEEGSPVSNLFIGLKYMLERDGNVKNNPYFEDIYSSNNIHLLENNAYLPLGFLANSQLLNTEFIAEDNKFEFQNSLIQDAAGISQDVWSILPGSNLTISSVGPELTPHPQTGYCSYSTSQDTDGTVTYSYTADREGLMCVSLNLPRSNSFKLIVNDAELYNETYSLPQICSVCTVYPGDVVEVEIDCSKNQNGNIKISAAILNETVFRECYELLNSSTLNINKFSTTNITGTISCPRDGVLYTSIPQNGNWNALVDGKKVEIVEIGNAMVGLMLSSGDHTIEFTYHNPAFSLGRKISFVSFLIFSIAAFFVYRPVFKRKKGKYER